jgi:hypothetical protein
MAWPVLEAGRGPLECREIQLAHAGELKVGPRVGHHGQGAEEGQGQRESVALQFRHGLERTKKGATRKLLMNSELRLQRIRSDDL